MWFYHGVMGPKDADRMANSVDPDQTAPSLFGQTCLSENLGSLEYGAIMFPVVVRQSQQWGTRCSIFRIQNSSSTSATRKLLL